MQFVVQFHVVVVQFLVQSLKMLILFEFCGAVSGAVSCFDCAVPGAVSNNIVQFVV